jgi:hypothetical protein
VGDAYHWIDLSPGADVVLVVAAVLGLVADRAGPRWSSAAGALCLVAAAVRLVGIVLATQTPVGGSAATMAFLAGLGLGFTVLGLIGTPYSVGAGRPSGN